MSDTKARNIRSVICSEFSSSAKPKSQKEKRGRKGRQTTPRITLRLSEEENTQLRERAGNLSVSTYVRECLFNGDGNRRKRRSYRPVADQQALAQILSQLGQSRIANNLNQIAHHANSGSLMMDEVTIDEINEAAANITWIRVTLIEALGLKNKSLT